MTPFDKLEIEDLPNATLREMANIVGLSNFKKILQRFAGQKICIPKTLRPIYYRKQIRILHFQDGLDKNQIAERLGISSDWVYRCLRVMK